MKTAVWRGSWDWAVNEGLIPDPEEVTKAGLPPVVYHRWPAANDPQRIAMLLHKRSEELKALAEGLQWTKQEEERKARAKRKYQERKARAVALGEAEYEQPPRSSLAPVRFGDTRRAPSRDSGGSR